MKKTTMRILGCALLAIALMFTVAGCSTPAEKAEAPQQESTQANQPDRAALLVTADELASNPDKYFVIDCRDDKSYAAGHIEGAINLPWQPLTSAAKGAAGDPDWATLLQPADMAKVLGAAGVDTSKTIVLYADPTGWGEDGRVMWSLASVGITNTRLLDGGFPYWEAAGNKVSKEATKAPATTVQVSEQLDADLNVTTDYVKENIGKLPILDVRNKKEYDGATDFGEKRGGRIPTAKNVEFPTFFNADGTLKEASELEKMFTDAGAQKDAEFMCYCTKGIRSGYATMVARWLGFEKAKNYDASYYAWAGDSTLELEK